MMQMCWPLLLTCSWLALKQHPPPCSGPSCWWWNTLRFKVRHLCGLTSLTQGIKTLCSDFINAVHLQKPRSFSAGHPKSECLHCVHLRPSFACCPSGLRDLRAFSHTYCQGLRIFIASWGGSASSHHGSGFGDDLLWRETHSMPSLWPQKRCMQRLSVFLAPTACLPLRTGKTCPSPTQSSMRCRDLSPFCHTFRAAPLLTPILKAISSPRYVVPCSPRAGGGTRGKMPRADLECGLLLRTQ